MDVTQEFHNPQISDITTVSNFLIKHSILLVEHLTAVSAVAMRCPNIVAPSKYSLLYAK